jgi:hypothetical protein
MLTFSRPQTNCVIKIDVLIVPGLQSSAKKAAETISNSSYNSIFLNFPRNLQPLISECALGHFTPQEVCERIVAERLIPEPVGTWFYLNMPLLEAIHGMGEDVKVHCYKDTDHYHMQIDTASKIANLTLRASVTGRVDAKEWIKVLEEGWIPGISKLEAEYVAFKAHGKTICLTGISGWKIANHIRKLGYTAIVKCVEKTYHFKPLEILESLLEMGKLTDDMAENLIWQHVNFVRDYVLPSSNLDEAYQRWILDKYKSFYKPQTATNPFSGHVNS